MPPPSILDIVVLLALFLGVSALVKIIREIKKP
jgi:hypothetical protein